MVSRIELRSDEEYNRGNASASSAEFEELELERRIANTENKNTENNSHRRE